MPYESTKDLPANLREKLPAGAEKAYRSAFNSAKAKGWDESRCHSYAWGAVKRNYRKSGDKWVKKAMATKQEKQMLRTANKIRKLVYADLTKHAVAPAIGALVARLAPMLRSLGPQMVKIVQAIPPEAWAQIGPMLAKGLGGAMGGAKAATVASVEKTLTKHQVKNAPAAARAVVLASIEVGAKHRKKASPEVTETIALLKKMETEVRAVREFI